MSHIYAAPWADVTASGQRVEYGPTAGTHARHLSEHKRWSWRPSKKLMRSRTPADAAAIRAYMRPDGRHLRGDVPAREVECYLLVYEHGHAARWAARHLEVSRATVRTYLRRLAERAGQ